MNQDPGLGMAKHDSALGAPRGARTIPLSGSPGQSRNSKCQVGHHGTVLRSQLPHLSHLLRNFPGLHEKGSCLRCVEVGYFYARSDEITLPVAIGGVGLRQAISDCKRITEGIQRFRQIALSLEEFAGLEERNR